MRTKWRLSVVLAMLVPIALAIAYMKYQAGLPGTLSLHFKATVGDESLVFNQVRYPNPGGEGAFKIRAFQFYLSNIKLLGESGEYHEPESYHLVRFDNENTTYTIVLDDIVGRDFKKIEFSVGVDALANSSIQPIGDLDPNSRMAWSWDVGYKFVLFEGGLLVDETLYPLVYHVGFDENYKSIAMDLDPAVFEKNAMEFKVDIIKLFKGTSTVDMRVLSSVKFDKVDAKLIADNYHHMVSY